jgi:hypothetical protein
VVPAVTSVEQTELVGCVVGYGLIYNVLAWRARRRWRLVAHCPQARIARRGSRTSTAR